jgi:ArsR family transcriptional regulator
MRSLTAKEHVNLVFRAFSDPLRLRIIHLLLEGELCVCDIEAILRVPQAKASRHLAYLRRAGLVSVREEWRWSYYRLAPARGPFHEKVLECVRCCLEEVPAIAADARRAGKLRRKGECCGPEEGRS